MFLILNRLEKRIPLKKGKIDTWHPPLGKWLYPKSEQVAMGLISSGRVTFTVQLCTMNHVCFNVFDVFILLRVHSEEIPLSIEGRGEQKEKVIENGENGESRENVTPSATVGGNSRVQGQSSKLL